MLTVALLLHAHLSKAKPILPILPILAVIILYLLFYYYVKPYVNIWEKIFRLHFWVIETNNYFILKRIRSNNVVC